MNKKGYLHTADFILFLLFAFLLLISFKTPNTQYPETVHVVQQMHDLISVWELAGGISNLPQEELVSDVLFMFPNSTYELKIDHSVYSNGKLDNFKKIISVESIFIDNDSEIRKIYLAVQFNYSKPQK